MKISKIFSAIFIMLFIALLPVTKAEATEIDFDDYGSTYAYDALASRNNGADRQKLYTDIYNLAKDFWTSTENLTDVTDYNEYVIGIIDISGYNLTETDVIETFFSFKNDHPIFYYISNTVWVNENGVVITADEDYKSPEIRESNNNTIIANINSYVSEVNSLSTDFEKVVAVHNRIVNNMFYEYDDEGKPINEAYAHNVLGALKEGKGVCESYARTFQLVMNILDIENYFITGVSNDENHAWNMVKLDDKKYYYVDCTWDDTSSSNNYLAKGSYVFNISHSANTPQGTGIMYLYAIPTANEDAYLKTFTLSCNGTNIGRFSSMELAFKKMTNKTGKYVIDIDDYATVYVPGGQWPSVREIKFDGGRGFGIYYPVQLLGDATANSDIVINGIAFDTHPTYLEKNGNLVELNLGKNSFTAEQDVKFGGYIMNVEGAFVYGTGVNIKGGTGSSFNMISTGEQCICDVGNDYINVDKIKISNVEFQMTASDITANTIELDGTIRINSMLGATKAGTITTKSTKVNGEGHFYHQGEVAGCNVNFGNVIGNGEKINISITCVDEKAYPKVSLLDSTVPVYFSMSNSNLHVTDIGGETYKIWNGAYAYKGVVLNIGKTSLDKLAEVSYTLKRMNSNNEPEYYGPNVNIKSLFIKDSKGNLCRKYDENFNINNGEITQYAFMDKCNTVNLIIPKNVKSIGAYSFRRCYSIKSLTIPANIITIGDGAFVGSPQLKTVTIPSTVTSIGSLAFGYNFNEDTQEYTKVQGFTIICEKGTAAEAYAIENGIKYVTKPSKVSKFKVSNKTANSITLKWNKDNSANGYIIKQYNKGKWVNIKKITNKSTTSYKVTGLSATTTYKFRIVAYNKVGTTYMYSKTASSVTGTTNPKAVTKLKSAKTTKNSIKLSWGRNKNVNGYVIEMKKGKKWVQVKKITKNSTVTYTQTKLSKKTEYSFRIKAYKKVGKTTYYSTYKTIKTNTK